MNPQPAPAGRSTAGPGTVHGRAAPPMWRLCTTPADAATRPSDLPHVDASQWIDAPVPGTVGQALAAANRLTPLGTSRLGEYDHWYRLPLRRGGARLIRFDGLAGIAQVWLNDTLLLQSTNMFVSQQVYIDPLPEDSALYLCFRSLARHLDTMPAPRRARWRTRLVDAPALRAVRISLFGHMPGWFPRIEPIGPWGAVAVINADADTAAQIVHHKLSASIEGRDGIVEATITFAAPVSGHLDAVLDCEGHHVRLQRHDRFTLRARLTVPNAKRWWPHTHGEPARYAVSLHLGDTTVALGYVGFRAIEVTRGHDGQGFALSVNALPIFVRGACWSTADPLGLRVSAHDYRTWLTLARDAGFNMIRVGGTMTYEDDAFYASCDELGLLVWQDFMFANFDYPCTAPDFVTSVKLEASQFLARTAGNPSLAVLCGGSEIAQQASMVGLSDEQRDMPLTASLLAELAATHRGDVPYVSDTPSGQVLPFYPRTGISHYYGVGAYLRPLDDARRAAVRFASECLAFAHVPADATLAAIGSPSVHEIAWKMAVPRDPGAPWDFDDVRDHYLRELYGQDPARLRGQDPSRYLELSRAVLADVVSETMVEWRRTASSCTGALLWQFQDVMPGAGWGIVDAFRRPKSTWYALKHVLQSQQVCLCDEGLNGLDVHVFNDGPAPLRGRLELVALRDAVVPVTRARCDLHIEPHGALQVSAAQCLGRFFDFTYAYRFGPREHDTVIASLYDHEERLLAQSFYFPERTAPAVFERDDIGLNASLEQRDGQWWINVGTRASARYVQITAPGLLPKDDWFHLAPGANVSIPLLPESTPLHSPLTSFYLGTPHLDTHDGPGTIEIRAVNSNKVIRLRKPS
ncbi:beta-mannosidase [Burkholderia sp. b14]|nr:beta-mannosidase [Burkholderia sp. b14]